MKTKPNYRSFKLLGIFWVIKLVLVLCLGADSQKIQLDEPEYMYLFEYLESTFYIAMMLLAGYEDIKFGSKQLKWVIMLTILMGVLLEKLAMIVATSMMGAIGVLVLVVIGIAVFGAEGMAFFGILASWAGILGPIALIAFLVSSIFSGFSLYG